MATDIAATCEDAQALQRQNPDTFLAPSLADVEGIRQGTFIKICRNNERFWTIAVERRGSGWLAEIIAKVGSMLVMEKNFDLPLNHLIQFQARHAYEVVQPQEMAKLAQRMMRRRALRNR